MEDARGLASDKVRTRLAYRFNRLRQDWDRFKDSSVRLDALSWAVNSTFDEIGVPSCALVPEIDQLASVKSPIPSSFVPEDWKIVVHPMLLGLSPTDDIWWTLANTLSHEMCHVWQFTLHARLLLVQQQHNPNIAAINGDIATQLGIPVKIVEQIRKRYGALELSRSNLDVASKIHGIDFEQYENNQVELQKAAQRYEKFSGPALAYILGFFEGKYTDVAQAKRIAQEGKRLAENYLRLYQSYFNYFHEAHARQIGQQVAKATVPSIDKSADGDTGPQLQHQLDLFTQIEAKLKDQ